MIKYILMVLLISTQLFSEMKIKVKNENNLIKVNACVDLKKMKTINNMYTKNSEFEKETNEKYVTQIIAKSDGKTLFSVSTSPNILTRVYRHIYPKFEFKYKEASDELQVITINSDGQQIKDSVKIKINHDSNNSSSKLLPSFTPIDFRKTNLKAFESNTVAQAIRELYNTSVALTSRTNDINLVMADYTMCNYGIPINISSSLDLESIAIFSDNLPNPLIAVFSIPNGSIIDYKFKVIIGDAYLDGYRYSNEYSVMAVGKDRNGKFYLSEIKRGALALSHSCDMQ